MDASAEQRPLITILLLCYKHEKFAAEAVRGVLSQTYSPLEIVIVDDCSPDGTAAVIEKTLSESPARPGVRFIRNPRNMHSNRVVRTMLGDTKGDFIFVSHGDDVMLPHMVEEMAKVWIAEDLSLVTANGEYIDENSNPLHRTFRDPNQTADDSFETLARDGSNACCFGPAIGFERAIYTKFDWVPRYLRAYDIMYPFYAYLLKGARFIPTPLIKYRVHGNNTSQSLVLEKAVSPFEKAVLEERMLLSHIAHATLMEEQLDRLRSEEPDQYRERYARIMPLLAIQQAEMAKKLARVSRAHGTLASGAQEQGPNA